MTVTIWQECIDCLKAELPSQQFNTWIRPLHAELDPSVLRILAPNRFILDWVKRKFLPRIAEILTELGEASLEIRLEVISGDASLRFAPATSSRPRAINRVEETVNINDQPKIRANAAPAIAPVNLVTRATS